MAGELIADLWISSCFVGHEVGRAVRLGYDGTLFLRFLALPPTYVSSASTTLFAPPKGSGAVSRRDSRIRWQTNHAVLGLNPNIRPICKALMPFLDAISKCVAASHLCSGILERS